MFDVLSFYLFIVYLYLLLQIDKRGYDDPEAQLWGSIWAAGNASKIHGTNNRNNSYTEQIVGPAQPRSCTLVINIYWDIF